MAYDFTAASSQYLSMNSAVVTGGPITLAAWFNRKNTTATHGFVSVGSSSSTNFITLLAGVSPNNFLSLVVNDGVNPLTAQTVAGATANTWHHGCGTFSSSKEVRAFLNGTNFGVLTATANLTTQDRTTIGARFGAGGVAGQFADALIADVGIWDVVLSDAEIASLAGGMTCDKVRPQSLVFYAPLVRDLVDVKGGLTITNNNTATVANHPRVYA
jgi:hypothetical protein